MKKRVSVYIPATSANLGPGFDVLGVALGVYNEVHLDVGGGGFSAFRQTPALDLRIEGEGADVLPRDATNLVVRAIYQIFERVKKWPKALRVRAVNRIPLARGLGSSSSATLGGLCAANALTGGRLSLAAVIELAIGMEGHPDNVVPALVGGLCVAGVVNGEMRYVKFPAPRKLRAVVCSPEKPLETHEARRVLPSRIPFSAAVFTSSRVAFLLGALLQRRFDWLSFAMEDVLHQPPRAKLIPGLLDAIRKAKKAGAYGAALSGAGSSVIAFTKPGPIGRRIGRAMQKSFASKGIASRWQELSLQNKGVRYR